MKKVTKMVLAVALLVLLSVNYVMANSNTNSYFAFYQDDATQDSPEHAYKESDGDPKCYVTTLLVNPTTGVYSNAFQYGALFYCRVRHVTYPGTIYSTCFVFNSYGSDEHSYNSTHYGHYYFLRGELSGGTYINGVPMKVSVRWCP